LRFKTTRAMDFPFWDEAILPIVWPASGSQTKHSLALRNLTGQPSASLAIGVCAGELRTHRRALHWRWTKAVGTTGGSCLQGTVEAQRPATTRTIGCQLRWKLALGGAQSKPRGGLHRGDELWKRRREARGELAPRGHLREAGGQHMLKDVLWGIVVGRRGSPLHGGRPHGVRGPQRKLMPDRQHRTNMSHPHCGDSNWDLQRAPLRVRAKASTTEEPDA